MRRGAAKTDIIDLRGTRKTFFPVPVRKNFFSVVARREISHARWRPKADTIDLRGTGKIFSRRATKFEWKNVFSRRATRPAGVRLFRTLEYQCFSKRFA